MDFITKLPTSKGHDSILVVYDRFSKMLYFVATTEKTTAEGLARLFRDNVWKLHGLPESVISDRGLQFAAGMTKKLNKMLGIKTKLSTAYHPDNWAEWLAMAEFAFNNKMHTAIKMSLFEVNYGRKPRMGFNRGRMRRRKSLQER